LGKDRHDAQTSKLITGDVFTDNGIGTINAEMINNLTVDLIEHSYGKPYLQLDEAHFSALKQAKRDNYEQIYFNGQVKETDETVHAMMEELYDRLLSDYTANRPSPIFSHHMKYLNKPYYIRPVPYEESEPNQIVVDYIASMTDDYFVDLYSYLFPKSKRKIAYVGYFDHTSLDR
jgi:dGTPase